MATGPGTFEICSLFKITCFAAFGSFSFPYYLMPWLIAIHNVSLQEVDLKGSLLLEAPGA